MIGRSPTEKSHAAGFSRLHTSSTNCVHKGSEKPLVGPLRERMTSSASEISSAVSGRSAETGAVSDQGRRIG